MLMEQDLMALYDQVNAFGRDHEMTYKVLEPGHIEYYFTPKARHLATPIAAHGGMIAAFMDAVIGVAALSAVHHEGKLVATVEFKINFIAPATPHHALTGTGKVVQKGRSLLVVKGDIVNEKGTLIATALGTLKAYPYQPFNAQ